MKEVSFGVGRGDRSDGLSDGVEQGWLGTGFGAAQVLFDFGPHHLDGVEVRAVSRKEEKLGSALFDEMTSCLVAVGSKVVADDDVTRTQSRAEDSVDVFAEDKGVGSSFDHHALDLPVEANGPQHGRGVPLPARRMIVKSLALSGSSSQPCHVGLGARFIQEDETLGWPFLLLLLPESAFFAQVSAILFAGPQRFFYSGSPVGAACDGWSRSCNSGPIAPASPPRSHRGDDQRSSPAAESARFAGFVAGQPSPCALRCRLPFSAVA